MNLPSESVDVFAKVKLYGVYSRYDILCYEEGQWISALIGGPLDSESEVLSWKSCTDCLPDKKKKPSSKVTIYTDGSCLGNPGPGGYAAIITRSGHRDKEVIGSSKLTTNNRMELQAAIQALEAVTVKSKVTLYTDSKYLVNGFKQGWLANWKKNGWRKSNKKPVENVDLWKLLDVACSFHSVDWKWVKGHDGDKYNEMCDELAKGAARKAKESYD